MFFSLFFSNQKLLGGFKYFFLFTPKIGEDEPILTNIFQMSLKPPTTKIVFYTTKTCVCFSNVGDLGGVISQTEIWTAGGQVLYDVDYSTRTCHLVAKAVVVVTKTQKPMVF